MGLRSLKLFDAHPFRSDSKRTSPDGARRIEPVPVADASNKQTLPLGARVIAGALPVVAFSMQWILSIRADTQPIFAHHLTVVILDWVFVPFNYFVVSVIEWRRGGTLFIVTSLSVVLNVGTHAFWQYNRLDPGHMITPLGVVLPAGWVHLAFSIIEMILLMAFVFCRKLNAPHLRATTALAGVYFVLMAVCGYAMHGRVIVSDFVASVAGLFFVLAYPRLVQRGKAFHPPGS
jgi:hypothetical protein